MSHSYLSEPIQGYGSMREIIAYFKRSEASLWVASNSLEQEALSDELIDRIYVNRESYAARVNAYEPETLAEVSERLGLWVLQHYPDRGSEPQSDWDELIVKSYFQLTGFLGVRPLRDE